MKATAHRHRFFALSSFAFCAILACIAPVTADEISDLLTTADGQSITVEATLHPCRAANRPAGLSSAYSEQLASEHLSFEAMQGMCGASSGLDLTLAEPSNLHNYWRLRYFIRSHLQSSQARIAIELQTRMEGFAGINTWRQKPDFHVLLDELTAGWNEINLRIHVKEFERSPNSPSNGALLELEELHAIRIRVYTDDDAAVAFDVGGFEFYDRSPYADFQSTLPSLELPEVQRTPVADFAEGGHERLGVFINDTDSAWLDFVAALRNIGLPIKAHQNLAEALQHSVLVVYPEVSASLLNEEEQRLLREYVRSGGTLIGLQLGDESLNEVFGVISSDNIAHDSSIRDVAFDTHSFPGLTDHLDHPYEQRISIYRRLDDKEGVLFTDAGPDRYDRLDPRDSGDGSIYGYQLSTAQAVAVYDDDSADNNTGRELVAISKNTYGKGTAYSIGWDVGYQGSLGRSLEYATLGRMYSDGYSPGFDVTMGLFKSIYHAHNENSVSLWTVPFGKDLSMLITHDIDAHESSDNVLDFARLEQDCKSPATYFWQTRYMNDARDMRFLDNNAVRSMEAILEFSIGHEIASHSVSHSFDFARFPLGGDEQFPDYAPRSLLVEDYLSLPENKRYQVSEGTVGGELTISKYLLEELLQEPIVSFRPGHLAYPVRLNELALQAGYQVTSTTTAPYSSTHLPYLQTYQRSIGGTMRRRQEQLLDLVEIPLSWEDISKNSIRSVQDEQDPERQGMMEPEFIAEVEEFLYQLSQSGGSFNLLIHPTEYGHQQKLDFELHILDKVFEPGEKLAGKQPHFTSIRDFGQWWLARSKVGLDVTGTDSHRILAIHSEQAIRGLAIKIPDTWQLLSEVPGYAVTNDMLIIDRLPANVETTLEFRVIR